MVNYNEGKIYKIINDVNEKVYIGSTCKSLAARMANHRYTARHCTTDLTTVAMAMAELGVSKFQIILVKHFPCTSREELQKEEYRQMKLLKARGICLYNSMTDTGFSEQQRRRLGASSKGRPMSDATRAILFKARFKRGCISYGKRDNHWAFVWKENGKQKALYFSCRRHGSSRKAKAMAIAAQNQKYPLQH